MKRFILLVLICFLPLVGASVTEMSVSPASPVKGDTIEISGMASPGEEISVTVTFSDTVTPDASTNLYKLELEGIKIPTSKNSFTVEASPARTLQFCTKVLIWLCLDDVDASGDVATKTIGNIPKLTYDIMIKGKPIDAATPVTIKVTASSSIYDGDDDDNSVVNADGSFEYSYDTSPLPAGTFNLAFGGVSCDIGLASSGSSGGGVKDCVGSSGGNDGSSGGGGGGGGGGGSNPVSVLPSGAKELDSSTYYDVLLSLSNSGKLRKDRFVEAESTLVSSLLLTGKYPLPTDSSAASFATDVEKITGDVYSLAADASRNNQFLYSAHEYKLVVARGDLGVDSMAAISYAKAKNIPIFLVKPDEVPLVTREAMMRILGFREREVIIAGGPAAISEAVLEEVVNLPGVGGVRRVYGETRVETAVAFAEEAYPDKNKIRSIVVTDYENPRVDAVLLSYLLDAPLLYVQSSELSPAVRGYISDHRETMFGPTKAVLLGVDPERAAEIEYFLK